MRNPKEDRRVRRTQKLLKESLVQLMSEKAFKDITIKDLSLIHISRLFDGRIRM